MRIAKHMPVLFCQKILFFQDDTKSFRPWRGNGGLRFDIVVEPAGVSARRKQAAFAGLSVSAGCSRATGFIPESAVFRQDR
jgi:hypothetical protein